MKTKLTSIIFLGIILSNQLLYSQATTPSNTWNLNNDFVGWDATAGSPDLNILHMQALPINFYTNSAWTGPNWTNQRMTILGTSGFVGIGLNFSAPTSLLQINGINNGTGEVFRTDGNENTINRWRLFTAPSFSATPIERFSVNALTSGSDVSLLADAAECEILFEQAQMSFKIKKAPVIQITHKKVIIQSEFVLKASDGDNYFVITVNSKGELTTKSIDKKTLFESN